MRSSRLGIGEVALRHGVAAHVLRHWEDRGLLAPARDGAGRRRYGDDELARVAVILRGKEAGLSLDAIRVLVEDGGDPVVRRAVLGAQAAVLRERIAAARAALGIVECALGCESHEPEGCGCGQAGRGPERVQPGD
ncbi:MerR family transcriptional regulator [Streptomyces sp. NPDC004539]|uniref:MerR family transcriptional regulator n=1 Tax=Streptomyces sp. NPDC004539 TaxID=3154280 RepID=UPI0033B9F85B